MGRARYAAVIAMLLTMAACNSNEPQSPVPKRSDEVTHELAGTRWAVVQLGGKPVTISEGGRESIHRAQLC